MPAITQKADNVSNELIGLRRLENTCGLMFIAFEKVLQSQKRWTTLQETMQILKGHVGLEGAITSLSNR